MLSVNLNISPPWSYGVAYDIMMALGGSDKTMIVGGAIRDWLSDIPVKDIDFATKLSPEEAMIILVNADFNVKPIGIDHGTIAVYKNNKTYEITSLRKDILTDGRHAKVIFGGSWEEDAYRRDFTFNALYADEFGTVIDPTGLGFQDLENKIVRFIGKPEKRIKEDYIRILRYFRFLSLFSENIDNNSMDSCIKQIKNLNIISGERVLIELDKIFLQKKSKIIIDILVSKDVMNFIYSPALLDNFSLNSNIINKLLTIIKKTDNRPFYSFILYTSFIIGSLRQKEINISKIILSVAKRFKLSNQDKFLLIRNVNWIQEKEIISKNLVIKLWLDNGEVFVSDFKDILSIKKFRISKDLLLTFNNPPPKFPISGKDLKKIGLKEGKKIGLILNIVRDWWINNDCIGEYKDCIEAVKRELKKL